MDKHLATKELPISQLFPSYPYLQTHT